ncbi:MAG: polyphenol oxidase family protein, partial [Eggerthellaceae bacterium]|nr:polyphenol oxidase family protein [Eggerthellaceae bacterium]
PIIAVSPSGRFAVIHAGWRGVEKGIAPAALEALLACDRAAGEATGYAQFNIYIGPYIHAECFEASAEVCEAFGQAFGPDCLVGENRIDLAKALRSALVRLGIDPARIVDAGICSACENESYFSYRAQNGVCGRQGAFAFRLAEKR